MGIHTPKEIIRKDEKLKEAINEYAKMNISPSKIWKKEWNYIIHEDGVDAAFFEEDLKLSE
jgi:hypothetical protein